MKKYKNYVTALRFVPGKNPDVVQLPKSVDTMDKAVSAGAYYKCKAIVFELEPHVYVLYNEEAPLLGLKGNRKIFDKIIAGTFFIVATDEKDYLTSLPEKLINQYGLKFWDVEEYSDKEVSDNYLYYDIEYMMA